MIITKLIQQDLDAAVADEWKVCGQKRICPRTADYELPDSWKPDWYDEEMTLSEITPDMAYELKETTRLYNEEFEAIWQSYYEDYLAWLEEEREFENYLRTESCYW